MHHSMTTLGRRSLFISDNGKQVGLKFICDLNDKSLHGKYAVQFDWISTMIVIIDMYKHVIDSELLLAAKDTHSINITWLLYLPWSANVFSPQSYYFLNSKLYKRLRQKMYIYWV